MAWTAPSAPSPSCPYLPYPTVAQHYFKAKAPLRFPRVQPSSSSSSSSSSLDTCGSKPSLIACSSKVIVGGVAATLCNLRSQLHPPALPLLNALP
ncbi:hypothetical protein VTL71DRAFT_10805 [Oculimacula yallundae]|uniref:Uncharacterized protein n=1 Tax=Oculimacula yallundae TaxID=86028 RepID=A0ABR4CU40_9HELO